MHNLGRCSLLRFQKYAVSKLEPVILSSLKLNHLPIFFLILFVIFVVIQTVKFANLDRAYLHLRPGMSKVEVIRLMGEPDSKKGVIHTDQPFWDGGALGAEYGKPIECWQYCSIFPQIWTVSFNRKGNANQISVEVSP